MNRVAVVRENEATIFAAGVDLEGVVVAVQPRRGNFNPRAVDFTERGLILQPRAIVVEQTFDFGDAHEKRPFSIRGGSVMLQWAMKA